MDIATLTEEQAPLPDAGLGALATNDGNLPLESVDVRAAVVGLSARTELDQRFRNPFDVTVEATYIFPLPDRAAVTAMRMEAADRVIEGTLKEREQARTDYDTAVAAGHRAAIAEEERPDVFTMRVGNILPGERVTVRLTLSQALPYEDGHATLRFPLVVAPRYVPGAPLDDESAGGGVQPDTDAVPDASRISPPVLLPGFPDPVRLALSVDVDPAGLSLTEMRSSLHAVASDEGPGGHTTVRLHPGERLNRDFILRLCYAAGAAGTLTPDDDGDGDEATFALTVLPPADEATPRPRDVVLVLDRSGSMAGWKMVAARRAAARIIDTLTGPDRFTVVSFDHEVDRPSGLPEGLVEATDRNRFRAVEHLASLTARGGTEMLRPLHDAVALLGDRSRDRVLVLVTDGQVGNEDQILSELKPRGARIHTVGVDTAVNAGFLGRLAAQGSGRCELVESEDRLDEAMDQIHRRIGAPLVTDVTVDFDDIVADTLTPARPADIFPGVPLILMGRTHTRYPTEMTLRGATADGEAWEHRTEIGMAESASTTPVWARAHLRNLEDRYAAGSLDADLESRIVATSLRFGVLCRFTAFVAVDSRASADGAPAHQVVQPVELPEGWQPPGSPPPSGGFAPMFAEGAAFAGPPGSSYPSPAPFGPPQETVRSAPGSASAAYGGTPAPPEATGAPVFGRKRSPDRARTPVPPSADVRARAAEELELLRSSAPTTERQRRQVLADLGSRLAVLLGEPGTYVMERLTDLVEELRRCDDPDGPRGAALEELWDRTLRILTAFAEEHPDVPEVDKKPSPRRRATRRAFWKRD